MTPDYQPPPFADVSPLSPQQLAEMDMARKAMKGIRRAVFTAQMDGWSLAVFGGLTLICGLSSPTAILVGLGLGAVAFVELRHVPKLKQLDPASPRVLAYNQIALATVLILYALWNLLFPSSFVQDLGQSDPAVQSALRNYSGLANSINQLVYFALIAIALGAQGSMALFYFRKEKTVKTYLATTPPWIVQMQRAGFSL